MSTDTQPLDPQERGRRAVAKRWASATQAVKNAATARMRAALAAKAVTRAQEQAQRLGIELTDEQAADAGATLLKHEQRERMAVARTQAEAAKADQKRERDATWAADQMMAFHSLLRTWAPDVPSHQQAIILTLAVREELDAPDGFSRPRLIRRLRALADHVREQAAERSRQLAVPGDANGFDELFASVGMPDPGRRSGPLSELSPEEQQELLDLARKDGRL